jgi:uncharacterized protein YbjQ (UPF0145 family)
MTARSSGTRGFWGSTLTADEFAAVRSVGFEPVGQVFGAAVYGVGPLGYTCPANVRPNGAPATQVSGRREAGSFGPLVQARYQARDQALGRMTAECRDLGGHGVVGVQVSRGAFLAGGVQFTATGTAVRAPGAATGPRVPFASGLTGQDFAKLMMTGWVPAGLVLGISIGSRHDDRDTARQVRWTAGNTEVAGWTELVNESRHDARRQLEEDLTRFGAEGVVITAMELRIAERDCPAQVGRRDHIVEATLTGTAIARFTLATQHPADPTLTIMSLDPQRRQAARIRI